MFFLCLSQASKCFLTCFQQQDKKIISLLQYFLKNLLWNSENCLWDGINQSPRLSGENMMPELSDVGYTFIVPKSGVVRLKGTITMPYADCRRGDGVSAYIYKENKMLFKEILYSLLNSSIIFSSSLSKVNTAFLNVLFFSVICAGT